MKKWILILSVIACTQIVVGADREKAPSWDELKDKIAQEAEKVAREWEEEERAAKRRTVNSYWNYYNNDYDNLYNLYNLSEELVQPQQPASSLPDLIPLDKAQSNTNTNRTDLNTQAVASIEEDATVAAAPVMHTLSDNQTEAYGSPIIPLQLLDTKQKSQQNTDSELAPIESITQLMISYQNNQPTILPSSPIGQAAQAAVQEDIEEEENVELAQAVQTAIPDATIAQAAVAAATSPAKPKKKKAQKKHICSICNKAFTQHSNLTAHKRTHTGEKPYECDQCGKRFTQSGHLKEHKRTHTDDKPHQCDQCGKTFRQIRSLRKHITTHNKK